MKPDNLYFTSDLHLGHANIIKYTNRPFASADEMDEAIIQRWNTTITNPESNVFILGDVSFHSPAHTIKIINNLNGHKHLVFGNHDKNIRKNQAFLNLFENTADLTELEINDPSSSGGKQLIVLCHYFMWIWNKSHVGSWHLYGHSHGTQTVYPYKKAMDVGVDSHDFRPISYATVKADMQTRTYIPVDCHDQGRA